jgi:hypothetical protein
MGVFDPNKVNQKILLDGEEVYDGLLGLSVSNEINRVPRARLEFNYRLLENNTQEEQPIILKQANGFDRPIKKSKADFLPGKKIEIQLSRGTSQPLVTVFDGYVISQNIVSKNDGAMYLYVECRHACNRMALHKRTRFHHHDANQGNSAQEDIDQVNDLDILKKLISYYKPDLDNVVVPYPKLSDGYYDNMTQYNCTDWDFLIIRAEAMGYVCFVSNKDVHLVIPEIQSQAKENFSLKKDIFEYEALYDETISGKVSHLSSWDIERQKRDYENLKNSEADFPDIQTDVTVNYGPPIEEDEKLRWLGNEVRRQEQATIQGVVKVKGTEKIFVNDTISISGFNSVWDGGAYVSAVKHVLKEGSWHTHIQCGIDKTPHAEKYNISPLDAPFLPKTDGLLFGQVVQYKKNNAGFEMIEVEIPAYNENETTRTVFARLANFSAGAHGGSVFRPYPGDEVVLGFVNNDPRFPVILGSLYNSDKLPPYEWENSESQQETGFSINGWKMSIREDEKSFIVASPSGQQLVLDDENKCVVLIHDNDNYISVSQEGIDLTGCQIKLNASDGIVIEGTTIKAKSNTTIKLEANTQLELEGKVTASLKGQITQIN